MSHHHHRHCSDGESITNIAIGVMVGIWAAKIVPILIVGVLFLSLWLLYKVARAIKHIVEVSADRLTRFFRTAHRWIAQRSSPRAAMFFWFMLSAALLAAYLGWSAASRHG